MQHTGGNREVAFLQRCGSPGATDGCGAVGMRFIQALPGHHLGLAYVCETNPRATEGVHDKVVPLRRRLGVDGPCLEVGFDPSEAGDRIDTEVNPVRGDLGRAIMYTTTVKGRISRRARMQETFRVEVWSRRMLTTMSVHSLAVS